MTFEEISSEGDGGGFAPVGVVVETLYASTRPNPCRKNRRSPEVALGDSTPKNPQD